MSRKKSLRGFLTSEEVAVCQQIAIQDNLYGQRATALLAINEGKTQTQASEQAKLTIGQLRYILIRFKQQGLASFPKSVLNKAQIEPIPPHTSQDIEKPLPVDSCESTPALVHDHPPSEEEKEEETQKKPTISEDNTLSSTKLKSNETPSIKSEPHPTKKESNLT